MNRTMLDRLKTLDRRWIFLLMFVAVAVPVLRKPTLPEKPTPIVRAVFDEIENLPSGSRVLFSFDYDPASKPELGPMNTVLVRHAALRGHRLYFMTLWPFGPPMIQDAVNTVEREFGDEYEYGVNYIDFGFRAGQEAVIRLAATDLAKTFPVDAQGRPYASYPINDGVQSLQNMDLVVSVGAGYPGTKEWVQYLSTPFPKVRLVGAVTGVSAPPQYPYYPAQLKGMLPAIKGAAEYEAALAERYPQYDDPELHEALGRMGPQLSAHILMLLLIVLGNVIYFLDRRKRGGNA